MKKRTMLILAAVAVAVMAIAVPAFAQSTDQAPTQTLLQRVQAKVQKAREFPPEWINLSLDELKTKVQDRADQASQRIDNAPRLSDEQKTELQASIDSMLDAVDQADANAEVAGTAISRVQLERQAFRAERNGGTPDYEAHIAGDIERAQSRMERLTKVAGWADIAGEDVTAISSYLDEASTQLEIATGSGTVQERHDAVHIALAWETEAAAALDNL
jgi:hypothetical protein